MYGKRSNSLDLKIKIKKEEMLHILPSYLQNSALSTAENYLVVTIMRIPSI
jgi:hypothetical protein